MHRKRKSKVDVSNWISVSPAVQEGMFTPLVWCTSPLLIHREAGVGTLDYVLYQECLSHVRYQIKWGQNTPIMGGYIPIMGWWGLIFIGALIYGSEVYEPYERSRLLVSIAKLDMRLSVQLDPCPPLQILFWVFYRRGEEGEWV